MTLSSCFICVKHVAGANNGSGNTPKRGRPRKITFGSNITFKELLQSVCKLLSVTSSSTNDWDFINDLKGPQDICCEKCYELLRDVEGVHQVFLTTQKLLKKYLDNFETLILKSEERLESAHCLLWDPSCFQFRTSILNRTTHLKDDLARAQVKTEREIVQNEAGEQIDEYNEIWNVNAQLHNNENFTGENDSCSATPIFPTEVESTDEEEKVVEAILKSEVANSSLAAKVIWDNNQLTLISNSTVEDAEKEPERISRKRSAKRNAEQALKEYASYSAADEKDPLEDDDYDIYNDDHPWEEHEGNAGTPLSQSDASAEEDDELGDKMTKRKTQSRGISKTVQDGPSASKKIRQEESHYYPILVADEDLYFYRSSTYFRKTATHLQCQAYQCNFEADWNYYTSFKIMKKHMDDNHCHDSFKETAIPHPCVLCKILLDTPKSFVDHIKEVHEQQFGSNARVICEWCLKIVSSSDAIVHRLAHKNAAVDQVPMQSLSEEQNKVIVCDYQNCEKEFQTKQGLIRHNRKIHGLSPSKIQMKIIQRPQVARALNKVPPQNLKRNKEGKRVYFCDFPDCGREFLFGTNFKRHMRSHLPPEERNDKIDCPECGVKISREGLKNHLKRIHFPEQVKDILVCEYCNKRFMARDKSHYETHLRRHRGEKPFSCDICGASFSGRLLLRSHINATHEKEDPKPCELCGKIYRTKKKLRTHMVRKHRDKVTVKIPTRETSKFYSSQVPEKQPSNEPRFACDVEGCSYTSNYQKNFLRHKQSHLPMSERTDKSVCSQCGQEVLNDNLIRHMRRMHTAPEALENVLSCHICDRRFLPGQHTALAGHIRRHQGIKSFLCTECPKTFFDAAAVNTHMRHVHAPQDPVSCEFCDQVYTKANSLKRHIERLHPETLIRKREFSRFYTEQIEEKKKALLIGPVLKYPCPICETVCSYKVSLKKHLSRIHGIEGDELTWNVETFSGSDHEVKPQA